MIATVALWALLAPATGDPLKTDLLSDDAEKAAHAATKLGASRRADVLLEVLALGAPPKVTGAILDALVQCKTERALDAFLRYSDNRSPDLRKRALAGLSESSDKRGSTRLLEALG